MTTVNENYVLAVCKTCKAEFTYYKHEKKKWCCSEACEAQRKVIARRAAMRWKPLQEKRGEAA